MGIFLNSAAPYSLYESEVKKPYFVDKSLMLEELFLPAETGNSHICITRPRRFGKTVMANMVSAFFSRGVDSTEIFSKLKIAESTDYKKHLNTHDVIRIDFSRMPRNCNSYDQYIERIERILTQDLMEAYPKADIQEEDAVWDSLDLVYERYGCQRFIFVFDEWDCIFREYKEDKNAQEKYLDFLRDVLKDKAYIHLAYMTGILPIKKYGTHSALNMFDEFSMIDPGPLAEYVGFTEAEVRMLCEQYQMDMTEVKCWYDGYSFENEISIYSPRSVVSCMRFKKIGNYWNQTETFEALRIYIDMNFEGLKDDVLSMIAGNTVPVNIGNFSNDMSTFHFEDDVLTLLIHLGYVSYDYDSKTVKIPNEEVRAEYVNSVSASEWGEVSKSLKNSADTLEAIWQKRPKQVAEAISQAHFETSHIQYNDENALSYTISLALYAARNFYVIHRELAGGKGFADLVFIPRKKFPEKPAIVVELKWDKDADGAIAQIKNKEYCRSLEEYRGNVLLVGVNYNRKTKVHECVIEEDVIGTEIV